MNIETIISHIARTDELLESHRLGAALESLSPVIPGNPTLGNEFSALRETYRLMARYSLDGADDPQRTYIFNDLSERTRTLARSILRDFRLNDGDNTLYFSTLRYVSSATDSADSIISRILSCNRQLDMAVMSSADIPKDEISGRPLVPMLEEAETQLFNRVWVEYPMSQDTSDNLTEYFANPAVKSHQKEHLVSAILLGELDWHDERRLMSLANIYGNLSYQTPLRMKALVSLIISIWHHRGRQMTRGFKDRFSSLTDTPGWDNDVKAVWMELVRARDTERVTRKIKDELIPEIMKLRPDIEKRLGKTQGDDVTPMEENPEWQEILENSGLSKKLKELSEIQENGGDIMMGTFGHLKTFPFFRDVANWFLPFHAGHSVVSGGHGAELTFFEALESTQTLCDNDKYSLACAFAMMPASQRDMFRAQLAGHEAQMAEMLAGNASGANRRNCSVIAKYVQNLYRFFKLFRRKNEFHDIFSAPVNLASLPALAATLGDPSVMELVAEFYFNRGYWNEALELFIRLDESSQPSATRFQKMGYCCQHSGNFHGALKYYQQSELLKSDSLWTLQRIAACQRSLSMFEEALATYRRIETEKPDDATASLMAGHCLLALNRYSEALKSYFKVDFLEPERKRALRPIAWTLLLTGEYDRSRIYYDKILSDSPNENDYLNCGHLEMLSGNFRNAVRCYSKSMSLMDNSFKRFNEAFSADMCILEQAGVDPVVIGIVRDAVESDK